MEVNLPLHRLDKESEIESEIVDYNLIGTKEDNSILWMGSDALASGDDDFWLKIKTDSEMKTIQDISFGAGVGTPKHEIYDTFLSALFSSYIDKQIVEADGFEHTDDTNEIDIPIDKDPYDPKLIRVDPKQFSIEYICKLISSKKLDLSPDFQREFVWTEISRKSRLIESLMLRIPIPTFYLAQDYDGTYQVVDGIQRLTVIYEFINNEFKLRKLEYLKELEGLWFRDESKLPEYSIPPMYSGRIEETQLHFNIIDASTPDQVKYDIFRRLNTGGKALNAQEIRNCLSSSKTRALLSDLVTLESFLQATRRSVSRTRMADKELALRFVGFYLMDRGELEIEYKGNMSEFLDSTIEHLNKNTTPSSDEIVKAFDMAMKNAFILFGDKTFRKSVLINKALFLSLSRHLYKFNNDELVSNKSLPDRATKILGDKLKNDLEFEESITYGTNDTIKIEKAYKSVGEMLEVLFDDR